MQARPAPRGSNLPGNIEACLHMLSAIIQKYNDQDEDDAPQENDYLQAMDLLKRINDLKLQPSAAVSANQQQTIRTVTQVVIQWRSRETGHVPRQRVQTASIVSELEAKSLYLECHICQHLVKDRYALARHQKRLTCRQVAILKSYTPRMRALVERLNVKNLHASPVGSCVISDAFLLSISWLCIRSEPIIRRPKADASVPLYNHKPFPQRLIPKRLWNSIWDPRGYFHDELFMCPKDSKRMLVYDPSMFMGKVYPKPHMPRKSLTTWPFVPLKPVVPQVFTTYQFTSFRDDGPWSYWAMRMSIDVADDEECGEA